MAMLILTLVATLAAGMVWQQWRAIQVEAAERARTQSAWILSGALDWARLILREDARTGGADHLGEPWAVPLAEARLSTFLAADRDNNSAPKTTASRPSCRAASPTRSRAGTCADLIDAEGKVAPASCACCSACASRPACPATPPTASRWRCARPGHRRRRQARPVTARPLHRSASPNWPGWASTPDTDPPPRALGHHAAGGTDRGSTSTPPRRGHRRGRRRHEPGQRPAPGAGTPAHAAARPQRSPGTKLLPGRAADQPRRRRRRQPVLHRARAACGWANACSRSARWSSVDNSTSWC